jgi:hypothetical protein
MLALPTACRASALSALTPWCHSHLRRANHDNDHLQRVDADVIFPFHIPLQNGCLTKGFRHNRKSHAEIHTLNHTILRPNVRCLRPAAEHTTLLCLVLLPTSPPMWLIHQKLHESRIACLRCEFATGVPETVFTETGPAWPARYSSHQGRREQEQKKVEGLQRCCP